MTSVEVLQGMRDTLMERGWCQGTLQTWDNRVCLIGSLVHASEFNSQGYIAIRDIILSGIGILDSLAKPRWGDIIDWNDTPGRTFNEVIDAIDTSILAEKERERDGDR